MVRAHASRDVVVRAHVSCDVVVVRAHVSRDDELLLGGLMTYGLLLPLKQIASI